MSVENSTVFCFSKKIKCKVTLIYLTESGTSQGVSFKRIVRAVRTFRKSNVLVKSQFLCFLW